MCSSRFFRIADSNTRFPRLIPRALAISAVILCAGAGAQAEDANPELPAAPILRVETQHHDAVIRAIDADAASRFAVTAAYDKTVRVWSLSDGHPLRVLRLPIDQDDIGKAYANYFTHAHPERAIASATQLRRRSIAAPRCSPDPLIWRIVTITAMGWGSVSDGCLRSQSCSHGLSVTNWIFRCATSPFHARAGYSMWDAAMVRW